MGGGVGEGGRRDGVGSEGVEGLEEGQVAHGGGDSCDFLGSGGGGGECDWKNVLETRE